MDTKSIGLGITTTGDSKIAIIGGGITGITAAYELLKCGYKNVHLYEATDRLGGRHDTHYDERTTDGAQYATFEGGAMRFPPFLSGISQDPALGESVLSYYVNEYNIATEGFPNPGSEYADTGIYYNEGYQEDLTQPELAFWL